MKREFIFYKHYFRDFYNAQTEPVRDKFDYCLEILRSQQVVPLRFAKHLGTASGIYELRTSVGSKEYRTMFFFEKGSLIEGGKIVILGNVFLKKDNKDYLAAIRLAEKIRSEYFEELNKK